MAARPERLNLAVAKRCYVACRGCYTYFGGREPDLAALESSVAAFVRLGIGDVTLSGGDPLTIDGLSEFLHRLRDCGVQSIKVDTVGVDLQQSSAEGSGPSRKLTELLGAADFLGIPLDGWSNESVQLFRRGRRALYAETTSLLDLLDSLGGPSRVVVNTVAHRGNLADLDRIGAEVLRHGAVAHWNIFQYTPTDQAAAHDSRHLAVGDEAFARAEAELMASLPASTNRRALPSIAFRSSGSRVGQYLLINSDGDAWLPDALGRTVLLGNVYGEEARILQRWVQAVAALQQRSIRASIPRKAVRMVAAS
ncbi:MAG: radical SAM protein [Proteobacteria bacterium]|nr:radical SAM protein [Burkholderiales bacterium]